MWTGEIYSIVYEIFEQLDYNCSIFVDRGIDKNILFVKEEKKDLNFYKEWFKLLNKYFKLETVRSQFQCASCAEHPLQLQLCKEKLIIANYCTHCGVYLTLDEMVKKIKYEDTPEYRRELKEKEVKARRAEYRRAERIEREMFVQQYLGALKAKNDKEKEKKEKYQARLEEAKKRRARNRKSRERYREKLAAEGKTITVKRKVGGKGARNTSK